MYCSATLCAADLSSSARKLSSCFGRKNVGIFAAAVERVVVVVVVVARSRARRDDVVVAAAPHRRRNVTRRPEKTPRNRAREKRRASVEER